MSAPCRCRGTTHWWMKGGGEQGGEGNREGRGTGRGGEQGGEGKEVRRKVERKLKRRTHNNNANNNHNNHNKRHTLKPSSPAVNTQPFAEFPLFPLVVAPAQLVLVGFTTFPQSAFVPPSFVKHLLPILVALSTHGPFTTLVTSHHGSFGHSSHRISPSLEL